MARVQASTKHGVTYGQHSFAQIPRAEIQRSVFNRSCGLKTAFDSGFLIPIFVDEALPGDTFTLKTSAFVRMATPIFPVMDNFYMDVFFFAVPNRLVWDNWQKFNGEQVDPGDSIAFTVPTISENVGEETLSDFLGIPIGVAATVFNSLHHRAYNFIWNEWFRDENLQDSVVVDRGDGPDTFSDYVLLRRGKRHDYFTSCLPFTQKGAAVQLPLGSEAPVTGIATVFTGGDGIPLFDGSTSGVGEQLIGEAGGDIGTNPNLIGDLSWNATKLIVNADVGGALVADLSAATSATINEIREAFQIQRLLERDARGGSRYTEIVRSHFGVVSPDQRLQRPEYLGGGSTRINVNPVAVTAQSAGFEIGDLAGFVTASFEGLGFMKSFTEHCVILGLVNVRADLNYQQGLNRMFSRQTRFDYFWPALAHLGEQSVLNKEIFVTNPGGTDDNVFGFQERYAEYRYKPSGTTGKMRSTAAAPLDKWHLGLDFSTVPVLNATFIQDAPPFARVIAVTAEPEFFGDFYFDFKCARPMPTFSVPGMIDHF